MPDWVVTLFVALSGLVYLFSKIQRERKGLPSTATRVKIPLSWGLTGFVLLLIFTLGNMLFFHLQGFPVPGVFWFFVVALTVIRRLEGELAVILLTTYCARCGDPDDDGAAVVDRVADRARAELLRRIGLEDILEPVVADKSPRLAGPPLSRIFRLRASRRFYPSHCNNANIGNLRPTVRTMRICTM